MIETKSKNITSKVFKTVKTVFGKQPAKKKADKYHFDLYGRYPIALVRGKGSKVWDDERNEYIDALAGIAVNNLGHCHPDVVKAIQKQAEKLIDRKSTRLNSSHVAISYAVFCLKKKD